MCTLNRFRLFYPIDWSPPGSSVHRILQARILEWVAISFSRGSSQSRDWTRISCVYLHWQVGSLPLAPPGKPVSWMTCFQTANRHLCPTLLNQRGVFPFSPSHQKPPLFPFVCLGLCWPQAPALAPSHTGSFSSKCLHFSSRHIKLLKHSLVRFRPVPVPC